MNGVVGRTSNLKDVVSSALSLLCIPKKFKCKSLKYIILVHWSYHADSKQERFRRTSTWHNCGNNERLRTPLFCHNLKKLRISGIKYFGGGPMEFLPFRWWFFSLHIQRTRWKVMLLTCSGITCAWQCFLSLGKVQSGRVDGQNYQERPLWPQQMLRRKIYVNGQLNFNITTKYLPEVTTSTFYDVGKKCIFSR